MAIRAFEHQGVGDRLRHARDERGLSLEQAAAETRIERRFLEALERDAPTDSYPGPVFARSFLREYARYLGLNARPLVDAYRASHPERDWPFIGGPAPIERRTGSLRRALGLLLVTVAVVVTVVVARREGPDAIQVPDVPATGAPPAGVGEIEPRGGGAPAYRGVVLRLRVVDAPCWISVSKNGGVVLGATQDPGFVRTFRARRSLSLVLGNADAVRMTLNGRRIEPEGSVGDVYSAAFAFRGGRARVVPSV